MRAYFITFRSVTYAQRGESVLRSAGIGCTLQRTPRWMEVQGCGYCLKVRLQDGLQAVEVLRQKQVPFRKLYIRKEDDSVEEVAL